MPLQKHVFLVVTVVFLLLFSCVAVCSEETGLTIQAPDEVLTGNLVILTVPESTGNSFCWTVIPNEMAISSYYVCDGGRTLVFASRIAGTYHFILSAATDDAVLVLTHRLNYLEQDQFTPLPPVIDEENIADWVQNRTKTLVRSARFQQESEVLANTLLQTARMIDSGQIRTTEQARTTQRSLARQQLAAVSSESASQWENWQNVLAGKLIEMSAEGKFDTTGQIADVFRQIASGLQASTPSPERQSVTGRK